MKSKQLVLAGVIVAVLGIGYFAYKDYQKKESLRQWLKVQNALDSMDAVKVDFDDYN